MIHEKIKKASRAAAGLITACLIWNIIGAFGAPSQVKSDKVREIAVQSRPGRSMETARIKTDGSEGQVENRPTEAETKANPQADPQNQVVSTTPPAQQALPTPVAQPETAKQVDINLLARVIHAEARGEPLEGQVAVGAVLLNRLHDPRFPKSLEQIVFKKGEFCTVRDGQVWLTPDNEARRAARLAVRGWDPTDGALYFYNPAKTTSRWIWQRPVYNRIGNHVFAG